MSYNTYLRGGVAGVTGAGLVDDGAGTVGLVVLLGTAVGDVCVGAVLFGLLGTGTGVVAGGTGLGVIVGAVVLGLVAGAVGLAGFTGFVFGLFGLG
ncbi:MAG: hypothetical protein ABIN95_00425 [Mucilaginibacter sp.]